MLSRFRFGSVAGAAQHGKGRIFRELRIGLRELTEEELGAFRGGDGAGVDAVGAKTECGGKVRG